MGWKSLGRFKRSVETGPIWRENDSLRPEKKRCVRTLMPATLTGLTWSHNVMLAICKRIQHINITNLYAYRWRPHWRSGTLIDMQTTGVCTRKTYNKVRVLICIREICRSLHWSMQPLICILLNSYKTHTWDLQYIENTLLGALNMNVYVLH